TYFGGENPERATGVALDSLGNAYISGQAGCAGLPATNIGSGSGTGDILVVKMRPGGAGTTYVTCVGGNGVGQAAGIVLDAAGKGYVAGATGSTNFPVAFPLQANYGGAQAGSIGDAVVFKLNPQGNALVFGTYLGGIKDDIAYSIQLDNTGGVLLGGISY